MALVFPNRNPELSELPVVEVPTDQFDNNASIKSSWRVGDKIWGVGDLLSLASEADVKIPGTPSVATKVGYSVNTVDGELQFRQYYAIPIPKASGESSPSSGFVWELSGVTDQRNAHWYCPAIRFLGVVDLSVPEANKGA